MKMNEPFHFWVTRLKLDEFLRSDPKSLDYHDARPKMGDDGVNLVPIDHRLDVSIEIFFVQSLDYELS